MDCVHTDSSREAFSATLEKEGTMSNELFAQFKHFMASHIEPAVHATKPKFFVDISVPFSNDKFARLLRQQTEAIDNGFEDC
jgi:hypothetical protein